MKNEILFTIESSKSIDEFIETLKEKAPDFNFTVRHIFDMTEEYRQHGVDVEEGFKLFQVVVCSFNRSYQVVFKHPEWSAVLYPPKLITVIQRDGKTFVHYLPFTRDFISQALPGEEMFPERLANTCQKIIKMIKASC